MVGRGCPGDGSRGTTHRERGEEDSTVKQHWLKLAVLFLTVAFAAPAGAQTGVVRNVARGPFNIAEAYPCAMGSYDAASGIAPAQVYCGRSTTPIANGAAPGILSLAQKNFALDVSCFAVVSADEVGPCFVQSYTLTKTVPGSIKCPDVYGLTAGHRYIQFGSGVRTWWALNFTPPGTQFILDVVSICHTPAPDGS